MLHRFALWSAVYCAVILNACAQDPFYRKFGMEDGLASNQVYCAMRDHEGFMWFGTDAGVSRFDGVEFVNYGPQDGLSDNEVLGIHEDAHHRLWFLTLNGVLSYWKDGRFYNGSTAPDLRRYRGSSGWISYCEDRLGRIWLSGVRGEVLRLDPDGDSDLLLPADGSVRSVVMDRSGNVLGLSGSDIERWNGEHFETMLRLPVDNMTAITVVQPWDTAQAPLTIGGGQVYEIGASGSAPLNGTSNLVLPMVHRGVVRNRNGDLWLYRRDAGIDHVERTATGYREPIRLFATTRINTVYSTTAGDQWYCTSNQGVLLVDRQALGVTAYHASDPYHHEAFLSIAVTAERTWIGSDRGTIYSYADGQLRVVFTESKEEMMGRILRTRAGTDGTVWFAGDFGLFRWRPENGDHIELIPSLHVSHPSKPIVIHAAKTVLPARNGTVWSAGNGLSCVVRLDGRIVRYPVHTDPLMKQRIYGMVEDPDGVIWLEGAGKLYALDGDSLSEHVLPKEYTDTRITDLIWWGPDTLAFGTAGKGVLLWKVGGPVTRAQAPDGLNSTMIRRMVRHGDTLWCATSRGAFALIHAGERLVDHWRWSTLEGLPTNDVNDLTVVDGRVQLVTAVGLCIAPVRPSPAARVLPMPHVAHVEVNGDAVSLENGIVRLGTADRCLIEVHVLEFGYADRIEYAYALDGSGVWYPCERGTVVLERIEEGAHTVQIRARLPEGPWTVARSIELSVEAAWWASRGAKGTALVLLIGLVLFGLYHWSRRGFRRKLRRIRAKATVDEERRRIAADVHDDLGADLSRLLMHARQQEVDGAGNNRISEGILASMEKIDEIIWSLDPRRDTLRSTVQFIEQQAKELATTNSMSFRTQVDIPEEEVPVSAQVRRELLLIAREAMRNVVEHAGAVQLRFHAQYTSKVFRMVIEDDGAGFDTTSMTRGRHGLDNMRERAERMGGSFSIQPSAPRGTRVEVKVPFLGII